MIDRARLVRALALSALVSLAGVLAAAVVVVMVAGTSPDTALSDGFFWGSAAALVVLHLAAGAVSGRLSGPMLSGAGLGGRARIAAAVAGPALIALVTNLNPVDGIPPVAGTLLPVAAAVAGVLAGLRLAGDRTVSP